MQYRICPNCGSTLDPGERCDCENVGRTKASQRRMSPYDRTKAQAYATGNKWAIENFKATHN